MKAILPLLSCIGLILAVGAALAPGMYHASRWLLEHVDVKAWPWHEVARADFSRVFNRAILVSAVILLPLFGKRLGLKRDLLPPLGSVGQGIGQALVGFVLAAGLLLSLGAVYVHERIYVLREPTPWAALREPITAALGAGIVEEVLFRGLILGLMLRTMQARWAMLGCTFLFLAARSDLQRVRRGELLVGRVLHLVRCRLGFGAGKDGDRQAVASHRLACRLGLWLEVVQRHHPQLQGPASWRLAPMGGA
jgi:membrane protease YdiL (CAAX protease family)